VADPEERDSSGAAVGEPRLGDTAGERRRAASAAKQRHGDRLSGLDAAFLEMESATRHMHVGSLLIFDPPDDTDRVRFSRFLQLVRSRLHLVPRYRQRLITPPLHSGAPVWVDDRHFDLAYHVRHAALPAPGTTAQLTEYSARILSRQLDRDRPLWELYLIEGLDEGRIALLSKNHHAMVDGLDGVDLATVLFDLDPDASLEIPAPQPWEPRPTPSRSQLAAQQAVRLATSPAEVAESVQRIASTPRNTARKVAQVGRGLARVIGSNLAKPAPRSLLNQPPGPHRRLSIQRVALEDVRLVKDTFKTTVNDVVLAVTADAIGRFLRERTARTDGLWLRAMVPVSTRVDSEGHQLGNRVVSVFADLPMFEMDPIERLRVCQDGMSEVRSSHAAVGANYLVGLGDFAPPTLHAMASRLAVNSRVYNFLVTNVPGPQVPIYCLGARLLGAFPFTSLAANHALGVGVMSIEGWLNFGFTADYDALPDIENLCGHLVDAVSELRRCAEAANEKSARLSPGQRTGTEADVITHQDDPASADA
jgi:diacylglycerol O-acyltransferase / wax synthase